MPSGRPGTAQAPSGGRIRAANSRPSLVDGAERALRNWLAPGRYRQGTGCRPSTRWRRCSASRAGRCAAHCSGWRRAARSCAARAAARSSGRMAVPDRVRRAAGAARAVLVGRPAARPEAVRRRPQDRASGGGRRGGRGARAWRRRAGDCDLAHAGGRRLAGRGDVRRGAPGDRLRPEDARCARRSSGGGWCSTC